MDVNPRLDVDISTVAALFSQSNLPPNDQAKANEILQHIRAGSYGPAKSLMDDWARPEFGSAHAYFQRKQFTAFLSKVPFTGDNSSRKRRAIADFLAAERRCGRTNKRLRFYSANRDRIPQLVRVALSRAREEISRILGPLNESVCQEIGSRCRPGSGVAIGTRDRELVSLPFKLGETELFVTPSAFPYARWMVEKSPGWIDAMRQPDTGVPKPLHYHAAHGNRITFVPKDARTLRTIAIEPALNICLQLGIHSYWAQRLKRTGNPIDDQTRNQNLAKVGSQLDFGASFCTIDLSQASDSVSYEIVRWLLPSDWFHLLCDLRCESGVMEGETILFNKFSSMGNGYTFALETILFLGLGRAVSSLCGGDVVSVYGDDIIIHDNASLLLTEVLNWAGFRVNLDKSFYHGNFRESCGTDWYRGVSTTPQYIRKASLRCSDVYHLLNRLDPVFRAERVRDYLLSKHREKCKVLYGLSNDDTSSCLFSSFDYLKGAGFLKWHVAWQTWTYKRVVFIPSVEKASVLSSYAAALRGATESRYTRRGRGKFRLISVSIGGVPPKLNRFTA